ncbi:hypothetical protein Patl1_06692 [Pistacia atlantica]|uniref:Uncharacterized protein n=1 Tax=Pistacia atlantica TaxID=434234 RepID=A0ACC1BQN3_9ROSI|nr:hypothetical protein Patl1_06692 [Pistacia atlantica]
MLAFIVFKKSLRDSLLFGFILNFKGMPDYVLIGGWRMRLLVDDEVLTTLMLSHMIVTAISAPIIRIFYKPERRLMSTDSSIEQRMMKPLQGMPLEMELRILFCINNEDNVNSLITLFKAWNPTEISPICAYAVHLMELIGRAEGLMIEKQWHVVSRMSSQPGFVITVFLIDFKGDYLVGNELETDLDNTAVKEFRTRTINNANVGFHEIEAYDSVQVMRAIISIEDKYDLVTVGQRRVANSILEKEMVPWVEQKELGILGDLIASSDFHRGMTSILVIQSAVTIRESLKSTVITSLERSSGFSTSTGDDSYPGRTFGRASERVLEILCTKI